ncbi:toprim domain-containing protein [Patescibacteria group bacterium]|nr:toprim domain-containing protein [Patescibacteria group bacterium]MBU1727863.1 toprim domain-containing protein [Patescibacteria group bacterium]
MDIIEKLTEVFKEFPGIGERQARRFVYFLMSRNPNYTENLSDLILDLKKEIAQCKECFRLFINKDNRSKICDICADASLDSSVLMIVEKDSDLESVQKSRIYHGKYFILGGLVPVVEKNTKNRIRINELIEKIKREKKIKEIILAFSLSPQGDHTDFYIKSQIKDICGPLNIKISSLGRGLSTGTELEYSDNETIKNALKNRQ